jgi:hypothetical protein
MDLERFENNNFSNFNFHIQKTFDLKLHQLHLSNTFFQYRFLA